MARSSVPNDNPFDVKIETVADGIAEQWDARSRLAAATAFQRGRWIEAWYATIGRVIGEPLIVTAIDRRSGGLAAMFPLICRMNKRLRVIEFADYGVSDYNAPVLGAASPVDAATAYPLWTALIEALPRADLIKFAKMPAAVERRINPLTLLSWARRSGVNSNVVTIDGSWESYLFGLERTFRKELARSWRVFAKHDGAAFRRVDDFSEASAVFAALESQQRMRFRGRGLGYTLDKPEIRAFYRRLLSDGIVEGSVVLTALTSGGEVVAALLGMAHDETYVMIRISTAGKEWSNCSPGRLVIVRTMQMLHARGYRHFDFSVGDFAYKRRLGVRSQPLFDLTAALTARGWPTATYEQTKGFLRQHPALYALARRMLRRDRSQQLH